MEKYYEFFFQHYFGNKDCPPECPCIDKGTVLLQQPSPTRPAPALTPNVSTYACNVEDDGNDAAEALMNLQTAEPAPIPLGSRTKVRITVLISWHNLNLSFFNIIG